MAKIDWIERRLENWARWRLKRSGHVLGFPRQNVLARFWQPPRHREAEAIVPIEEAEAWTMEQCIGELPTILKDTIEQRYLTTGSVADDANALGCGVSTVHARIEDAHLRLMHALNARRRGVVASTIGVCRTPVPDAEAQRLDEERRTGVRPRKRLSSPVRMWKPSLPE